MNRRRELLERLERLGPDLRRCLADGERRADCLDRFGGVTLHQLGALRHLVNEGPLTMNDLATRMEVSPSAATQLVDRLVLHSLAERAPDPDDRRALRVAASGSALAAVRAFEKERSEQLAALLAPLSEDELAIVISLAKRIVDARQSGEPGVPR